MLEIKYFKSKKSILLFCFLIISIISKPQALPIYIDGTYDDWENATHIQEDEQLSGEEIDFLKFTVSNDNNFLFVKIDFSNEIDLTNNNEVYIDIDADNNSATGWQVNGIGAEMDWNFGQGFGYLNEGSSWEYIYFNDIQLRVLPTVTSNSFEIAIGRHVKPNGNDFLFTGDTIKICFTNDVPNGDNIPNQGEYFTYIFDNTNIEPPEPILIEKEEVDLLRLMTYNIKNDFENDIGGLDDPERIPSLARIFTAIIPDIITINECWNTTTTTAEEFLNENLPTGTPEGWYTNKHDEANITASRWQIMQTWRILPDRRLTACLIDLPDLYKKDILVVSAHLKCCDGDTIRQREVDAFVSFINDAKTPGGVIDLPENTPFVLMGDLNLVGLSQQLTTLIEGDIQDTVGYGPAAPPDWDDSNLEDLISRQTDKRMAYTWRNDWGYYPPGRLDYMIYSNSVMGVGKAFTLQTEIMLQDRLNLYGLQELDTKTSSDHFPKVADFIIEKSLDIRANGNPEFELEVFPNPCRDKLNIMINSGMSGIVNYSLSNITGNTIVKKQKIIHKGKSIIDIDISDLPAGVYYVRIIIENEKQIIKKLIKL